MSVQVQVRKRRPGAAPPGRAAGPGDRSESFLSGSFAGVFGPPLSLVLPGLPPSRTSFCRAIRPSRSAESSVRVVLPSHPCESFCRVTRQSRSTESPVRVVLLSHPSESFCRVTRPSRSAESSIRVVLPSHPFESFCRVIHPHGSSESSVGTVLPSHPRGSFFRITRPSRPSAVPARLAVFTLPCPAPAAGHHPSRSSEPSFRVARPNEDK